MSNEDVLVGEKKQCVPFIVCFNKENNEVSSNCRQFEFKGIFCRHALSILIHKIIFLVFDKYILRRWRKDVKRYHTKIKISYDNWSDKLEIQQFDKMCNLFCTVVDLTAGDETKCNIVLEAIHNLKAKLLRIDDVCGRRDETNSNIINGD
ncbi:hypothetical protein G4B88_000634 [Cannabis sativa]|uniref:Protein FAR1-RELATED SEQUENCE n=1 Tax=Cannabis sativa TaxID=3483 RepID=A0A7J6ESH5_CANSA|nr:hypothetical protein G4B88_000634 [Cannabis sativa]